MKRYIYVIALVAGVCLTGCKDFLVQEPMLSQSTELTLSTYDGLDLSVAGAYAPLASGSWYNSEFIASYEMRTDNGRKLYGSLWDTGRVETWYTLNFSENATSSVWSYAYYVISAVNNVMDKLDEVEADEQDKNNLRAECLFLRAFSHFELVRVYAQPYYQKSGDTPGVPIILHTDPSDQSPRSTVKEVYDQIIEDLLEAESIIDPDYVRDVLYDERATITLEVIQAMLARVYLYSQQWSKAAEYATKVIDSGKYSMWTVSDMDGSGWNLDNSPIAKTCFNQSTGSGEVIFEIYQSISQSYGGSANDNICGLTCWDGYGDAQVTESLINSYDDADVRKTLFYEYESNDGRTGHWTLKYCGKGVTSPDVNNIIILRLSDMYLIRAEAAVNGASGNYSPMSDINMIRSNRGVSEFTGNPTAADILEERRLEFAWEAQLWFDLGRTGRDMIRTDNGDNVPTEIYAGDYRWAMAIPEREFQIEGNQLIQNDGY